MSKFRWSEVTAEDVKKAINFFETESPEYPEPRSTFLLFNGKKYPAKHIRGMAYKVHFGREISKNDFAGGEETFRFFTKLGFEVQYTHKYINTNITKKVSISKTKTPIKEITLSNKKNATYLTQNELSKIIVPIKRVTEQKNALQLLLNKLCDGDLVCEKTFSWMKTPSELTGIYKTLYDDLKNYRGYADFAKKNVSLRCDFVCESKKLIIEYDERQHFTEARRISLLSYSDIELSFDRGLWIRACKDIQARDSQPIDRDEIRAYYDSVRDIEAAKHGYTLVRIMHGQIDFEKIETVEQLCKILHVDHTHGKAKQCELSAETTLQTKKVSRNY